MKIRSLLIAAAALIGFAVIPSAQADQSRSAAVQFRGVCQQCGKDLLARYLPVECQGGYVEWQWVRDPHVHCRPACAPAPKTEFFYSYWMNPVNPRHKYNAPFRKGTIANFRGR